MQVTFLRGGLGIVHRRLYRICTGASSSYLTTTATFTPSRFSLVSVPARASSYSYFVLTSSPFTPLTLHICVANQISPRAGGILHFRSYATTPSVSSSLSSSPSPSSPSSPSSFTMGKKQNKTSYNTHLDGEKLTDNTGIRTTLQDTGTTLQRSISPPPVSSSAREEAAGSAESTDDGSQAEQAEYADEEKRKSKGKGKEKGKGKSKEENPKKPKKPPLTHFLCLPLVNPESKPELAESLERFARDVEEKRLGVPRKAIRPVGTLHLTLGVMSLDRERLGEVRGFLEGEGEGEGGEGVDLRELLEEAAKGAGKGEGEAEGEAEIEGGVQLSNEERPTMPLMLDLKALHPMQTPKNTSILYAEPVDPSSRLIPFAETLRRIFVEKGWMVDDKRPLRLHATVLNTVYAMPRGRAGGKGGGKWMGKGKKHGKRMGREKERGKGREREEMFEADEETGEEREVVDVDEEVEAGVNSAVAAPAPYPSTTEPGEVSVSERARAEGHGPKAADWMRFDASALIKEYKKFVWAEEVVVDRVQVCKMGARKILDERGEVADEQYEVVCERIL